MTRLVRRMTSIVPGIVMLLLSFAPPVEAALTWPRELKTERGTLTIYQPQPEKFAGNVLEGRAAASMLRPNTTEPTFGVFWFTGHVDTDRDAGTSLLRDITVTKVRWPDSKEAEERDVATFLTALMPQTGIPISLEALTASLATAEAQQRSLSGLKHDPPDIVVVNELSQLLLYDGEPRGVPIEGSHLEQIANAPFAVLRDTKSGACYLSGGRFWYSAKDPKGPWTPIAKPPAAIAKIVPPDTSSTPASTKPPRIVVATQPTELIATDGAPSWKPIGKGELLYIDNTESSVVREVSTGDVFVLISGRWYRSKSLSGPWVVVLPDKMPAAFKDIPPASELGAARVSVAGTPEAEDAMLDAEVPQTAAIDRASAKLEVVYDGTPIFKAIPGSGVEYATNTSAQVLRIGGTYYACDDAVWFKAAQATGPWSVADSVPMAEIKKIPPSEPVYNLTHVTIYESTPNVVYVGYTPGYLWSYPWHGCPIYGTGYRYPAYWGPRYYYARPVTYGLHVGYNPWTGWNFGFSYSAGFMRVGVMLGGGYGGYYRPWYPRGYYRPPCYFPPGGYRPPYYGPGHRPGYRPPHHPGRPRPTLYAGQPGSPRGGNLYREASNKGRVAPAKLQRDANIRKADRAAKGPNNVFADRDGNVHRKTESGWESRDQGRWKPSSPSNRPGQPSTRPTTRPSQPTTRPSQPSIRPSRPSPRPSQPSVRPSQGGPSRAPAGLDRDDRARRRGADRSTQRLQRPSSPSPRSGGGGRGRR